jgi:hypothetical protein
VQPEGLCKQKIPVTPKGVQTRRTCSAVPQPTVPPPAQSSEIVNHNRPRQYANPTRFTIHIHTHIGSYFVRNITKYTRNKRNIQIVIVFKSTDCCLPLIECLEENCKVPAVGNLLLPDSCSVLLLSRLFYPKFSSNIRKRIYIAIPLEKPFFTSYSYFYSPKQMTTY